jgi:hypothetical protein
LRGVIGLRSQLRRLATGRGWAISSETKPSRRRSVWPDAVQYEGHRRRGRSAIIASHPWWRMMGGRMTRRLAAIAFHAVRRH